MKNFVKEFASDLVNLFFPLQCLGCNTPLTPHEKDICVHCQLQLPFTYFHLDGNNPMVQKLNTLLKIEAATALCYFEKNMTNWHFILFSFFLKKINKLYFCFK